MTNLRYSATRGMLFAHMGWIFFKPSYPRMNTIGREDLDRDPGERTGAAGNSAADPVAKSSAFSIVTTVRQPPAHACSAYKQLLVPIALFSGFVFPALLAALWGDALGGFCYGGIWMRIFVWHCTFCVNS